MTYGKSPAEIGKFDLDWSEFMHYQYLPIRLQRSRTIKVPRRLSFLDPIIKVAMQDFQSYPARFDPYVYVTARRGWATPENPINRKGWHCDGFGSSDVNYIWTDRFPTRYIQGEFHNVSSDHNKSMEQFEAFAAVSNIKEVKINTLYRLTPQVIHSTPENAEGMRSFLKISFSRNRFNLLGNSRNYELAYDWKMYPREEVRNHPSFAGGDFFEEEL